MPFGTLEVLLVDAKSLDNKEFLASMDPYVLLTVRTQEKKSTVVSAQGSDPEWNETFVFSVSDDDCDLRLKIMDKDNFSADDFVGEVNISLEPVFDEGSIAPTVYNVVNKEQEYCGGIKIGLRFTPERSDNPSGGYGESEENIPSGGYGESEENIGGWKQSSYAEE